MNHHSLDDTLTAALSAGAPGDAVRGRLLDAIRSGASAERKRRSLWNAIGIPAALFILLVVGVGSAALLANRSAEDNQPDVVAAAVNLLEPPAPGTVRHVTSTAFVAFPSIAEPSSVRGESWERVNEDGSTTQAVVVYGDDGKVVARGIQIGGDHWFEQNGEIFPPNHFFPVAVPPEVNAAMGSLFMDSPEEFLAQLRTEVEFEYTTNRQPDTGNYVISEDITTGVDVEADGFLAGVEIERAIVEIELSESLDRFVRRESIIITPAGERVSINRVEFSGWEDVNASEVDLAVFSTEIPMTSPAAE